MNLGIMEDLLRVLIGTIKGGAEFPRRPPLGNLMNKPRERAEAPKDPGPSSQLRGFTVLT
jgi:hypothetical protein